jgi:[ribosomal protein S5]-alanine N-acetyltransferase
LTTSSWQAGYVNDPTLTDGVVGLRTWDPADAEWYADTVKQDELIQLFTSETSTVSAEAVREAIVDLVTRNAASAGFLIGDAATGDRLGNIALSHADGIGHVSYWLAAEARGRGVATRALDLLSAWAFERLGLKELRLWTHVDNAASRNVAERAGYQRDPENDQPREIKGSLWQTVAYVLVAPIAR